MIAFSIKQILLHPGQTYGSLHLTEGCREGNSPFPLPMLEYYSLGCCGIGTVHRAGSLQYLKKEELDAFFDWLDQQKGPGGWIPREWLFSLSDYQRGSLYLLTEHPKVKQIDNFLNKSHGPSRIFIYRYSGQKDFS